MKNLLSTLVALFVVVNLSQAQTFSIGTSAVYGDDIEEAGFNLRGMVHLDKHIGLVAEYTTFHQHDEIAHHELEQKRLWEINLNAEYNIHLLKHLGIYPLVGLNYSHELEDIHELTGAETHSYTAQNHDSHHEINSFGMNLGAGIHYELGHFEPFVEYGHLFSDLPQNVFSVGLMYHIGNHHHKPHTKHKHHNI
ncbi:outer membrane beta-barrel protein [Sediminitomix flava]|uniref:Outer membrane protein with beta-barrel domain n=1 Tax=Sediminitomix flava TaxID=379075 RepID=A0A315ZGF3_SEDFL|nr:outer membrane beta-barrel protein [Sediminitomix flava]PWJ44233.1 outer membrane protein with beta-barrel domain [Sediminitomix flava]